MKLLIPEFLWLLVPLALFAWLRFNEEKKSLLPLHPKIVIDSKIKPIVRLSPFIALAWMLVALSRPVIQEKSTQVAPALKTLYLAIDASASMQGVDRKPNRYVFAKEAIKKLVESDKSHKFALLAFTTNALIISPPTKDSVLIRAALESFNREFILTHGTSLKSLLEMVAKMSGENKELIIFSDGGDSEDVGELIKIAQDNNIHIFGVACATKDGSKIPISNGWLKDELGRLVVSILNPQLEILSLKTGGVLIDENTPDKIAQAVVENVEAVRLKKDNEEVMYKELFWIPLLLGIFFFLLGTISIRAFKQKILIPLLILIGINLEAGLLDLYKLQQGYSAYQNRNYKEAKEVFQSINPPLLESRYALANSYYRLGAYKLAGRLYLKCKSKNPIIKQKIFYNLGNCAFKLGHFKSAKAYYIKALQIGFDEDAIINLQKVLFLKKQKKKRIEAKANKKVKAGSQSGSSDQKLESKSKKALSKNQSKMGKGSGTSKSTKLTQINKNRSVCESIKRHPLSSKVYEMINKGYINEEKPW